MSDTTTLQESWLNLESENLSHRKQSWSDAMNDFFYSVDLRYPSHFLHGQVHGIVSEKFRIATMSSDPVFADRLKSQVNKDCLDAFFMVIPCGGDIHLQQRENDVIIRKGDFSFLSTMEPCSWRQGQAERFHILLIPGPLVRARKPDVDDYLAGNFSSSGLHKVFTDFASSFCRHAPELDADALQRTHDSLLDMLSLVLERADSNADGKMVRLAHRRRIHKVIEDEFRNPKIGPLSIAQKLGLSPRYVQHILSSSDESVSDLVGRRRMVEACRLLDQRAASGSLIATIAYTVGYSDPAYFSRVFRQAMGMSPLDYASRTKSTG